MKKYKKYRWVKWRNHLWSLLALLTPIGAWIGIKWADYTTHGIKLAFGLILGFGFAFALIKDAFKNIHANTARVMNLSILLGLIWLLESVLNDMFWIVLFIIVGYIIYIPFNDRAEKADRMMKAIEDEQVRVEVRESTGGRA